MSDQAQGLRKWGKDNQRFIALEDGQTLTIRLKSFKAVTKDVFGEEKEVMKYTVELANGQEKTWENGTASVANQIADIVEKKGLPAVITITRKGEGTKTKYEIVEYTGEFTSEKCPF